MSLRDIAKQVIQLMPELPREAGSLIDSMTAPGALADLVATHGQGHRGGGQGIHVDRRRPHRREIRQIRGQHAPAHVVAVRAGQEVTAFDERVDRRDEFAAVRYAHHHAGHDGHAGFPR